MQVVFLVYVVCVDDLMVCVEVEYVVDCFFDEFYVVVDYDQFVFVVFEEFVQLYDIVGVEVVCWFVEDYCLCVGEEDLCEFDVMMLFIGES